MGKYTREILESAVKDSQSIAEVMRKLGLKVGGGTHNYVRQKINDFNIDVSHILGQRYLKGKSPKNKKSADEVLVLYDDLSSKPMAKVLRRALSEIGREYECEWCHMNDVWNDKPIVLEIDHIDGNPHNNRRENLRFLCPNCHSQTDNYCSKNVKKC